LKLTIQKFLSRRRRLTQLHGVASDIVLLDLAIFRNLASAAKERPSLRRGHEARYTKWSDTHSLFIDQLRRRSENELKSDPEFHFVMEDIDRLRHKLDENRISLNEDARKKELRATNCVRKRVRERLARESGEAANLSVHSYC